MFLIDLQKQNHKIMKSEQTPYCSKILLVICLGEKQTIYTFLKTIVRLFDLRAKSEYELAFISNHSFRKENNFSCLSAEKSHNKQN